jgi:thiol-disulfide isomerase/thioredoxin
MLLAALVALTAPADAAAQFEAGIPVGSKAPVVTIGDLDGRPVDLGVYLGKKPVLIEFWATWCPICMDLLPQLEAVKRSFGDRVALIGVNITVNDSRERVRRYLERHRPPFLVLYDDKGASSRAYDVPTTSYVVVIDAAGTVVYTGSGSDQDLVAAVRKAVTK